MEACEFIFLEIEKLQGDSQTIEYENQKSLLLVNELNPFLVLNDLIVVGTAKTFQGNQNS